MPRRAFFAYNATGAILWTSAVTLLGYALGASWRLAEKWLGRASGFVAIAVVATAVVLWVLRRRTHAGDEQPISRTRQRRAPSIRRLAHNLL